jgi:hypothetical protein
MKTSVSRVLSVVSLGLLASLLLALDTSARVFVPTNSTWRYFKGTSEASSPTSAWRELEFDDSAWLLGAAPFHFGTNVLGGDDDLIGGTILSDMRSNYTCLFLRRQFVLPDTNNVRGLWLNVWFDDGLAIFINGQAARSPLSVFGALTYTNKAMMLREGGTQVPVDLSSAMGLLRVGTNVLCLQVYNRSLTDDDFRIDAELAETPATFAFAAAAYTVREDATQLVVPVVRTGVQDAGATIDYATTNGSAVAGLDYEAVAGTLSFAEGQTEQAITVPILNDARYEGTEDFQLVLTNPGGGATLGSPSMATVQITELITNPPATVAVLLGSNATFRVTAAGTAPLTYRWRFDERDLVGATNATLMLTNVTLADLGSYTVVVRDASGEATSAPAWLKLARWTEMVVFGASESVAQYSNGKSWVEWLGERLCFSEPNQIKNYAVGGARSSNVRDQINQYLSANTPRTNTLLAPSWAGSSWDVLDHRPVEQVVSNYALNLSLLAQAGGRVFVLPSMPRAYLMPRFSADPYLRGLDYQDLNARMDQEITRLEAEFGLTVFRFDFYDLAERVWADPAAYSFTNLTEPAKACVGCDPNQYFWWDDAHFTTVAHGLIAQETYRCLTPPLVIALNARGTSGLLECQWQGGSPPFRVQRCQDLISGLWQSEELTFQTNATMAPSAPHEFFRILQLGQ